MRRIAILSAAGTIVLAGQAIGAPVQCPSVSFTRTPVPAKAHRAAPAKPRVHAAKHRPAAKRRPPGVVVAKRAAGPRPTVVASNTLPVLAPILPPDTMPATTPVLAPGVQPATPIIGYRLKRSVKMVACEPVSLITTTRNDLVAPPGGAEAAFIPAAFQPLQPPGLQTPGPPAGPSTFTTTTPPSGCCTAFRPPTPSVSAIPEPSTWAMLIIGFFGLGAQLRANRRARAAAPNGAKAG